MVPRKKEGYTTTVGPSSLGLWHDPKVTKQKLKVLALREGPKINEEKDPKLVRTKNPH